MIRIGSAVIVEERTAAGREVIHGHVTLLHIGMTEILEFVTVEGISQEHVHIGGAIGELPGRERERTLTVTPERVEVFRE